jgi:hypothetical protein
VPWIRDKELQNLIFALLVRIAFVLFFLIRKNYILLFLPFGMGMFTLCHCMMEVSNLLFDFTVTSNIRIECKFEFWTMLDLLRLWGLLEVDYMHFFFRSLWGQRQNRLMC